MVGLVLGALGGIYVSAQAMTSDDSSGDSHPVGKPDAYGHKTSPGEGLDAQTAIARVLFGMDGSHVTGASVVSAPKDDTSSSAPWLTIELTSAGDEPSDNVELRWEAALFQGAVADLMRTDEEWTGDVIGGAQAFVGTASGEREEVEIATGFVSGGQLYAAQEANATDDEIAEQVNAVLKDFGLESVAVNVLHPSGPAISVVVRETGDQSVDWTIDDLRNALIGSPASYEGLKMEIDSPDGTPEVVSAVAYRTGLGSLWFAKGQDERFGALHG